MRRSTDDFAHPVAKTVACFVVILALPGVLCVAGVGSSPVPVCAFGVCGIVTLAGLSTLCGRPSVICTAIRAVGHWAEGWRRLPE